MSASGKEGMQNFWDDFLSVIRISLNFQQNDNDWGHICINE
jgi:hypothetical protein